VQVSLAEIVQALGGQLVGEGTLVVHGIAPLESAQAGQIAFLSHPKYQSQLQTTQAGCVIVSAAMQALAPAGLSLIVAGNPYLYFARLTQLWRRLQGRAAIPGIHPSAVVDPSATVHPRATIGPLCVVERGAQVGADTVLASRVTVGADCLIGARCILHAGVVIGADGFGFAQDGQRWEKSSNWVPCALAMT